MLGKKLKHFNELKKKDLARDKKKEIYTTKYLATSFNHCASSGILRLQAFVKQIFVKDKDKDKELY